VCRELASPSLRGTDLYAELRPGYGYQSSYPAFPRQLQVLRPAVVRDPEIRFETAPGAQTQADWAHLGGWPLGAETVELSAMVAILGCSPAPAFRFATDQPRPTTLACLPRCLDDLGGVTREVLTDRDPTFGIGQTAEGHPGPRVGRPLQHIYEPSPKHGPFLRRGPRGPISRAPRDGQGALDNSEPVPGKERQRVGIDADGNEVVFRLTLRQDRGDYVLEIWHGCVPDR